MKNRAADMIPAVRTEPGHYVVIVLMVTQKA
jgi:hypothetical protein